MPDQIPPRRVRVSVGDQLVGWFLLGALIRFLFVLGLTTGGFLMVALVRWLVDPWLTSAFEPMRVFLFGGIPAGFCLVGGCLFFVARGLIEQDPPRDD